MKTYFVFRKGKMVAVIQSKVEIFKARENHLLIGYDYIVEDPQDAERQIAEWKQR